MRKIMFSDEYGLTRAVLEGRKTQTRRIVHESALNDWEIHDKYHNLPDAVGHRMDFEYFMSKYARYEVGEKVAVAQAYKNIESELPVPISDNEFEQKQAYHIYGDKAGWNNKMFVSADLMPHRIRITNVRVERLQDISPEDCKAEGIWFNAEDKAWYYGEAGSRYRLISSDPYDWKVMARAAFMRLIDYTCGKGVWDSNPWVFVYNFELVQ